jgi:hypothetical protein
MRHAASRSPGKGRDAMGGRVERDIIGVLLGLTGLAALWWAGGWWWRAGHAEAAPPPRPPATETALPPAPSRFDRRRALTLMVAGLHTTDADAGASEAAAPHARTTPSPVSFGSEQGHGSDSWSRSDATDGRDFEPRYSLDAGTFTAPPPVVVEAPRTFH